MTRCKRLSGLFAVAGFVLVICAVVGKFVREPSVFGGIMPSGVGIAASSVMLGANTLLLLAVLARLHAKE